jgi:hypothetical protein
MSVHMLFDQLEVGQVFERTCPYDKETRRYMKVHAFCVAIFDSEGRFSGVDNKACNSINLKDGKPASFTGWEYVVVSDTQEIPDLQKNESVKVQSAVAFDDCDGGHDDGVCIRDIDAYRS